MPDALKQLLTELQEQTRVAGEYHERINRRLAAMPQEIAEGIDPAAIAKSMSEAFRQQIATAGLQDTAAALRLSVAKIKTLSGQLGASLKPAAAEYRAISNTIAADVVQLTTASAQLQTHNTALIVHAREQSLASDNCLGSDSFCDRYALRSCYTKRPNGSRTEQYGGADRAHSATFDSHAGEADHSSVPKGARNN